MGVVDNGAMAWVVVGHEVKEGKEGDGTSVVPFLVHLANTRTKLKFEIEPT